MNWKRWVLVVGYYVGILGLSSIPSNDIPEVSVPGLDKVIHTLIYGFLGLLVGRLRIPLWAGVLLVAFLGFMDEAYQMTTPGRTPDPLDWLADLAGGCMGMYIMRKWHEQRT